MPKHNSKGSSDTALQPKSTRDVPDTNFRHTQSHRFENTGKKKEKRTVVLTSIPDSVEIAIPSEDVTIPKKSRSKVELSDGLERKSSKTSKTSRTSKVSEVEKSNFAFQNQAFDDKSDKRSISSVRAGSSRTSSVQSLEIVREQYCCFAKRSRCERKLILTVAVLSLVIIVLVIVIAIIASKENIKEDLKATFLSL